MSEPSVIRCLVAGCLSVNSKNDDDNDIPFHQVPTVRKGQTHQDTLFRAKLRTTWLKFANASGKASASKEDFICSKHFESKFFQSSRSGKITRTTLIFGAVPTLFPSEIKCEKEESSEDNVSGQNELQAVQPDVVKDTVQSSVMDTECCGDREDSYPENQSGNVQMGNVGPESGESCSDSERDVESSNGVDEEGEKSEKVGSDDQKPQIELRQCTREADEQDTMYRVSETHRSSIPMASAVNAPSTGVVNMSDDGDKTDRRGQFEDKSSGQEAGIMSGRALHMYLRAFADKLVSDITKRFTDATTVKAAEYLRLHNEVRARGDESGHGFKPLGDFLKALLPQEDSGSGGDQNMSGPSAEPPATEEKENEPLPRAPPEVIDLTDDSGDEIAPAPEISGLDTFNLPPLPITPEYEYSEIQRLPPPIIFIKDFGVKNEHELNITMEYEKGVSYADLKRYEIYVYEEYDGTKAETLWELFQAIKPRVLSSKLGFRVLKENARIHYCARSCDVIGRYSDFCKPVHIGTHVKKGEAVRAPFVLPDEQSDPIDKSRAKPKIPGAAKRKSEVKLQTNESSKVGEPIKKRRIHHELAEPSRSKPPPERATAIGTPPPEAPGTKPSIPTQHEAPSRLDESGKVHDNKCSEGIEQKVISTDMVKKERISRSPRREFPGESVELVIMMQGTPPKPRVLDLMASECQARPGPSNSGRK